MDVSNEKVWKKLLETDSKARELAIKAGLENNPQRAEKLRRVINSIEYQNGRGIIKSDEERELAWYLCFCIDDIDFEGAIAGRIAAARAAGISINDL